MGSYAWPQHSSWCHAPPISITLILIIPLQWARTLEWLRRYNKLILKMYMQFILINESKIKWSLCCLYVLVAQLCSTLCNPMDCSPPGSSIHVIFHVRILVWVAISCPRGSSQPWDRTPVSLIAGRLFTIWATREEVRLSYSYAPHFLIFKK